MKQYCLSEQRTRVVQNRSRKSERNNCPGIAQMMAWVATRPLGQKEGSQGKDWNIGFGNLKFNHRHFIFDANHRLPTGDEDNIGFHCSTGGTKGPGALFSEDVGALGYTRREQISHNEDQDATLVRAINNDRDHVQDYHLIKHNCQDWVTAVRGAAGL